jgi:hypothetical protein
MYDTKVLTEWDKTAVVAAGLHNLTVTVIAILCPKSKVKPRPPTHFNPYRVHERQGMKITSNNFGSLKLLCYSMARK